MKMSSKTRVLDRGLDTSGGVDFVRERLALLGKTIFLLSFGFYVFLLVSETIIGGASFWPGPKPVRNELSTRTVGVRSAYLPAPSAAALIEEARWSRSGPRGHS